MPLHPLPFRIRRAAPWCTVLLALAALALAACGSDDATTLPLQGPGVDTPVQTAPDIPTTDSFAAPVTTPLDISSTFGPRWKYSASRYDFHRGIDYFGTRGDPLLSIGDGTVDALYPAGSAQFPNGGNTLVIRYDLANPFPWQGVTVDRLYAVYLHMDSFAVAAGEAVTTGQVVGAMGDTGDTAFVHLHFEIRLQTVCSLEFQLANPAAACAQWGFDPHVHPYVFVGGENADAGTLSDQGGSPFTVTWEADRGDLDLNVLESDLGTLNFNRRTGIDATTTAALDDFAYGWVTVVPAEFLSTSQTIRYAFVFPQAPRYVELRDIHGHGIRRTYAP